MTSQKKCDCTKEEEHRLQASAAKQLIDEQCCGSCPGGCVVQATKPVPPAVCEFAVNELADLRARLAKYEDAEGRPLQSGVVDDRAAFEAWYETTYGISLEPEFRSNHFIGYVNDKANHRWTAWKARAALTASAPNHSEQVREGWRMVKVGAEGVQFGNAWFSHERITGYTAEQLNSGNCRVTGRAYMDWLAAAPSEGSQKEQGE